MSSGRTSQPGHKGKVSPVVVSKLRSSLQLVGQIGRVQSPTYIPYHRESSTSPD